MAAPVQEIQPFTDISRWRLLVNEGGRHTWHYLKSDEESAAWPLTTLDKYWLGLPTGLPSLSPANDALSAARKGYEFYKHLQADDGHWPGEYGGTMFMLPAIVLGSYICGMPFKNEERLEMIRYLLNTAHPEDGGWGLHVEGESTVFGTALNYVSLRILGVPPDHAACIKARAVLHIMGGATGIPTWGKFWLCLLNVYDWEGINPVFPELLLLPSWLPVHPSRWWVHSRIIYHALCYLYGVRFAAEENELILSLREELYVEKYYSVNWPAQRNHISKADVYAPHSALFDLLSHVLATYEQCSFPPLRQAAITHSYNLVVAEDENTSYQGIAPLSKMFNAIVRLHHDGPDHDSYRLHQDTRQDFMWQGPEGLRVTGTNGSQTWDISFTVQALVETGLCDLEQNRESVIKALEWLEGAQMLEDPKHSTIMYRYSTKGAWGFSTKAQGYTVSDCTAEALKAVLYMQSLDYTPKLFTSERLFWAVDLLLGLQNPDGGFASYEPIRAPSFIEQLNPAEVFANAMVDVGHTECTTSVITALSVFRKFYPGYRPKDIEPTIRKAIQFVHRAQQPEGGWYGSWGICFTYATMFALESLSVVGETYDSSTSVKRACDYLIGKQRVDGGWGESWKSCVENTWVEHEDTQVTQTCWAAMALMHAEYPDPAPVERAVKLVMSRQLPDGSWAQEAIEGIFSKTCTIAYPNFKFYFSIWMLGMASRYLQNTKEKNVWGSKESKAR